MAHEADGFEDVLIQQALSICRIASPTFAEEKRARYIAERLAYFGLQQIEIDEVHNVTALLPGTGGGPTLMTVSHIDTVFPEGTDVEPKWDGQYWRAPGIRDNSASDAVNLLLPEMLRRRGIRLAGDLILAFSVGEEGLGNLRGIRALMERYASKVSAVIAVDGNLGVITHIGISVRRLEVVVTTEGGHSWADAGKPSAIHILARMAAGIGGIALVTNPKTALNIGTISGGTSVNAIAQTARFSLDLRSVDRAVVADMESQVRRIVAELSGEDGVDVAVNVIGDRPGGMIPANHPLVTAIMASYREVGVESALKAGSTDANIPLSLGIPAASMGVSMGGKTHTLQEYLDPKSLAVGADALIRMLVSVQNGWRHE
jgi:tripeptide aminopeptidase